VSVAKESSRGITQEKLAELVDLDMRSVQKIETGQINVLVTTAMRIQKALDCACPNLKFLQFSNNQSVRA